ncbi:hypothetical protein LWF15_32470 [Kineosporia rhizophila]|uniref:hypothetical protein n=1 Tax=Kineosporia rhizophila TaxID=84633 RepID=UPI001E438B58|nr:hypothetical protein [Kineosporia rhizophila]MCE0540219.1 hypothetical protein [Kineosporia rhizophila]
MTQYDRTSLLDAYLAAGTPPNEWEWDEVDSYENWRQARIDERNARVRTLEDAFGLPLSRGLSGLGRSDQKVLGHLFRSTLQSLENLKGPLGGFLDAGLLFKALERSGAGSAVDAELQRIEQANGEARQAHLRLLDTLLQAMLGDRADLVFSDEDLSC